MEFWNSVLTEKSWKILQELSQKPFQFILIGGWAAYLWTNLHKSKDIDIIIPEFKDLEYLKKHYTLKKNDALRKYEIQFEEIDVDIYVPYYSQLVLPIEEITRHTTTRHTTGHSTGHSSATAACGALLLAFFPFFVFFLFLALALCT